MKRREFITLLGGAAATWSLAARGQTQALFVPAKTPGEIVRKISADTNTVLADPVVRDKLAETGYVAGGSFARGAGKAAQV